MSAPSARPYFKAIRAKGQPDGRQAVLGDFPESTAPASDADTRRAHDFYPTGAPEAVQALMARDGVVIRSLGEVWEPAAGAGDMCRVFESLGVPVIASDLVDRGWPGTILQSFYDFDRAPARAIITNPPYCEINARDGHGRWLRHTLELPGWDYLALLLAWDWPAAKKNGLGELLARNPFSYCYLCRWKLDFTGEGSPPQRNAWFVWRKDWTGSEPAFRFLDRDDARQQEMAL